MAMMFLKMVDVKLKSIRLDKHYSESSYVSRFDKDTVVYIIPKKDATLNGSQKWKDTIGSLSQTHINTLKSTAKGRILKLDFLLTRSCLVG